jgi:hypothetical protein
MKRSIALLGAVSLFAVAAAAQDVPKVEVFTGFTYTRVNSASNVPAFSANGGGGQFVVNAGRHFGLVTDIGAVHNGNIGGYHLDTTLTNFMFGPRFAIRTHRVEPYFQALFGGVYGSTSVAVTVPPGTVVLPPVVTPANSTAATNAAGAIGLRAATQQTAFAMAFGGGIDIRINKHLGFRPMGLDYYMMRLQNLRTASDNNQHCIRYTTGFNFTFGGAR